MAGKATTPPKQWLKPPQIAADLAVKDDTVRDWIRSGELKAINVASTGCQRPRFRVDPIELELFLQRRSAGPVPKVTRRRKKDEGVIQFY